MGSAPKADSPCLNQLATVDICHHEPSKKTFEKIFEGLGSNLETMTTHWTQHLIRLAPRRRGCHLVTDEILDAIPDLSRVKVGLMHLLLQHTSASLIINENADPDVPRDLEASLNAIAPENFPYVHTMEGPDDMPAHVKNALLGCTLTLPLRDGQLLLGTWQGIYLCEHRNHGGGRRIVVTIQGELA